MINNISTDLNNVGFYGNKARKVCVFIIHIYVGRLCLFLKQILKLLFLFYCAMMICSSYFIFHSILFEIYIWIWVFSIVSLFCFSCSIILLPIFFLDYNDGWSSYPFRNSKILKYGAAIAYEDGELILDDVQMLNNVAVNVSLTKNAMFFKW